MNKNAFQYDVYRLLQCLSLMPRMHTPLPCTPCHASPLPCHASPLPCHVSPLPCHAPPATHSLPHTPCHTSPIPPHDPPLPAMLDPLPVNRITDRCKNFTFPQLLLRTVKSRMNGVVGEVDAYLLYQVDFSKFFSKSLEKLRLCMELLLVGVIDIVFISSSEIQKKKLISLVSVCEDEILNVLKRNFNLSSSLNQELSVQGMHSLP